MAYPVSRELSRMSGSFGPRKPILLSNGQWSPAFHGGVDFTPTVKGAALPVYAVGAGTIYGINLGGGAAGNNVMLRLPDGSLWWYGHLSRIDVRKGQAVTDGQQIGLMGRTGNTTGVHLHLERHYPKIDAETDPWPHIANEPDAGGKTSTPLEGDPLMALSHDEAAELLTKTREIHALAKAGRDEQIEEDGIAQAIRSDSAAVRSLLEELVPIIRETGDDAERLAAGLVDPGPQGWSWAQRARSVLNTLEKREAPE